MEHLKRMAFVSEHKIVNLKRKEVENRDQRTRILVNAALSLREVGINSTASRDVHRRKCASVVIAHRRTSISRDIDRHLSMDIDTTLNTPLDTLAFRSLKFFGHQSDRV